MRVPSYCDAALIGYVVPKTSETTLICNSLETHPTIY